MKHFIITVDTEGDNQWAWKPGMPITTRNAQYVERFQRLCERYGFPPVYLTNYEMILDDEFAAYLSQKCASGNCEIGMHIHAWNSPPDYELSNKFGGNPFITEYPDEIMKEKLTFLRKLIAEKTGVVPVSFRSGRWATNDKLFELLNEIGILVDCSITPGISNYTDKGFSVEHGNNYVKEPLEIRRIIGNLIEVPMTTHRVRTMSGSSIKNRTRNVLLGKDLWMRPAVNSAEEMLKLIKVVEKQGIPYLEFMIHSTELMPGGSPYTKDQMQVERFYERMEKVFETVTKSGYQGIILRDYYELIKDRV